MTATSDQHQAARDLIEWLEAPGNVTCRDRPTYLEMRTKIEALKRASIPHGGLKPALVLQGL